MCNSNVKLSFISGVQKIHSLANRDCFDIVMEMIIVMLDNLFSNQSISGNSDLFEETREFHFGSGEKSGNFVLFYILINYYVIIFLHI